MCFQNFIWNCLYLFKTLNFKYIFCFLSLFMFSHTPAIFYYIKATYFLFKPFFVHPNQNDVQTKTCKYGYYFIKFLKTNVMKYISSGWYEFFYLFSIALSPLFLDFYNSLSNYLMELCYYLLV